jgi:hypothetical protein
VLGAANPLAIFENRLFRALQRGFGPLSRLYRGAAVAAGSLSVPSPRLPVHPVRNGGKSLKKAIDGRI